MSFRTAAFLFASTVLLASCNGSGTSAPAISPTPTANATTPTPIESVAPAPDALSRIVFVDRLRGWALTSCTGERRSTPCRILLTEDGGVTWDVQHRARDSEVLREIQFLDAQHGFVIETLRGGDKPMVLATDTIGVKIRSGSTWDHRIYSDFDLRGIQFVTPERGVAIASGAIFQTSERGDGWVFNYGTPTCSFRAVDFPTENHGWATGRGEGGPCLYETSDGGETWSLSFEGVTSPSLGNSFEHFFSVRGERAEERVGHANDSCSGSSLHFVDKDAGWLVVGCGSYFSGGFAVLRTTDHGQTWQYIWGPTSCLMNCQTMGGGGRPLFFLDADHVWMQSRDTIPRSSDGGETWASSEETPLFYVTNDVFFVDANYGWLVTDEGQIGFTEDGGETWDLQAVVISD